MTIFEKRQLEIDAEHNWDKSDIITDYFNVDHYVDIEIGSYDKPFKNTSKERNK